MNEKIKKKHPTKMKTYITFIFLMCIVNYSKAENNITFDKNIQNAELIFIGKLIDRYERMESIVVSNGKNKDMVYTTHIFSIEEVLKGNFTGDTVSVKLRGGYDDELKKGAKYNKGVYYYDKDDDIQRALLFLNHDKLNNFYYSTQDDKTAFLIHGRIEVITDTDWVPIFAPISKNNHKQDTVTLDILRDKLGAENE